MADATSVYLNSLAGGRSIVDSFRAGVSLRSTLETIALQQRAQNFNELMQMIEQGDKSRQIDLQFQNRDDQLALEREKLDETRRMNDADIALKNAHARLYGSLADQPAASLGKPGDLGLPSTSRETPANQAQTGGNLPSLTPDQVA